MTVLPGMSSAFAFTFHVLVCLFWSGFSSEMIHDLTVSAQVKQHRSLTCSWMRFSLFLIEVIWSEKLSNQQYFLSTNKLICMTHAVCLYPHSVNMCYLHKSSTPTPGPVLVLRSDVFCPFVQTVAKTDDDLKAEGDEVYMRLVKQIWLTRWNSKQDLQRMPLQRVSSWRQDFILGRSHACDGFRY